MEVGLRAIAAGASGLIGSTLVRERLVGPLRRRSGVPRGLEDTLNFAALQGITPMAEAMPLQKAADGYQRMQANQARFRVVFTTEHCAERVAFERRLMPTRVTRHASTMSALRTSARIENSTIVKDAAADPVVSGNGRFV